MIWAKLFAKLFDEAAFAPAVLPDHAAVIPVRALTGLALIAILGAAACSVIDLRDAHSAAQPAPAGFDASLVARGAQLAAIGDCGFCHTAQGGRPFAGGRGVDSPFGTLYSTNITPDAETGIGRWSLADFTQAMREGVDPGGRHLYPAFPYDHFTLVTDDDIQAIYAYVMTRDPVRAESPDNDLVFPLSLRASAAAWKLMFFKREVFSPDPAQSEQWNRGFYLVQGLGHCGACHTPRNVLGAEKKDESFSGGDAEGWHAPALNQNSPAPFPWTVDRLVQYLRTGVDDVHEAAAGPMAPVVHDLSQVAENDVRAIAVYVASLDNRPLQEREKKGEEFAARSVTRGAPAASETSRGATIYTGACATCHVGRRQHGALELSLSTSLALPKPNNLLHIIQEGITPRDGERGPWMPSFAGALTDAQLAELADYLRTGFAGQPAWKDVPGELKKSESRKSKQTGGT